MIYCCEKINEWYHLARENRSQIQAVKKLARADKTLEEKTSSSRSSYKLFLAGVAVGIVIGIIAGIQRR